MTRTTLLGAPRSVALGLLLLALGLATACAEGVSENAPDKAVDSRHQRADGYELLNLVEPLESAHPYANNLTADAGRVRVHAPDGTSEFRIYFEELSTEYRYDTVQIRAADGSIAQTLTGSFQGWSEPVTGAFADVAVISDYSITDYGFRITAIQFKKPATDDAQWQVMQLGDDAVATPHNYPNHYTRKWTLRAPAEATHTRVNFSQLDTERGYDFVHLYDGTGALVATYTGKRGDFTSADVTGNVVTVELVSDYSVTRYGFEIHSIEWLGGTVDTDGCRSDDDCGDGQTCQQVVCITHPCPALCVDVPDDVRLDGLCSADDACPPGTACVEGPLTRNTGICASPSWDDHFVLPRPAETDHPYRNDVRQNFPILLGDWVQRHSLIFDRFELENGYDFAWYWADRQGYPERDEATTRWTGRRGEFETEVFEGQGGVLDLYTDYSVTAWGFSLTSARVFGLPDQLVAAYYDPAQCVDAARNPRTEAELRTFLDAQGISTYGIYRYAEHEVSCRACTCPAGDRFVLALRPDQAALFLSKVDVVNKGLIGDDGAYAVAGNVHILKTNPIQCGNNPWELWWRDNGGGDADEATRLSAWLDEVHGANLVVHWEQPIADAVCLACNCPRGTRLGIAVAVTDTDTLEALREVGFE